MKCDACATECQTDGGLCSPRTADDQWWEPWMVKAWNEHQREAHPMTLSDGFHRCEKGHRVEASPVDAMRAAGIPPLL